MSKRRPPQSCPGPTDPGRQKTPKHGPGWEGTTTANKHDREVGKIETWSSACALEREVELET